MATLAADGNPNVALTALRTAGDLQRAMRSTHAGLVLAAAEQLKGSPLAPALLPDMLTAFGRLTGEGRMTMRDPRVALLQRIGESTAPGSDAVLRAALADHDPAVAAVAASALSTRTGATVMPTTRTLPIPPLPSASYIAGLRGATARITMRGLGTMVVQLLPEEAPVTVATFAQLAESGQYDGLTFHRIVPNFVIQGGSPGADEYDGRTADFMRDELGLARNVRGSIGISTRGRDTGDGQIYFNLVDNVRLDRDYTVLATMRSGLDVMDRIQEGDVIERIEIIRRTSPAGRARR
jgi:cyclophilin family peptidyl-prolyl cis-trans isomerase